MRKGCRCRAYRRRSPPSRFPAPPCSRARYGRTPGRCRPGLVLGHTRIAPFRRHRAVLSHRPIPAGGPALAGGDRPLRCCSSGVRCGGTTFSSYPLAAVAVIAIPRCGTSGRIALPQRSKRRKRANARVPYPAPALPDRRAAARRSRSCPYSGASPPASSVPRRRGAAPGPAPRRAPRRSARHRCGW